MTKRTLKKPENMADENTLRVFTGVIEPRFSKDAVPDGLWLDGVPIEDVKQADGLEDIEDVNDNISVYVADYSINIYNSEYREHGLNVRFDELVVLRDALNKIIDSRPRVIIKNGDDVVQVDDRINDKYLYKK